MENIWLHLGLGSFHRAHQAHYFNELLKTGNNDWVIHAGNIRDDAEATVRALQAQGNVYTLETVDPQGNAKYERISSIKKLIPYEKGLAPLIAEGVNDNTKVIAFTVTEAGYYLDGMTVEVIADGKHLPASLLKLIYKIKGPDRICLVTDAVGPAGLEDVKGELYSKTCGTNVIVEDQVAKLPDRSAFAGSVAKSISINNMFSFFMFFS